MDRDEADALQFSPLRASESVQSAIESASIAASLELLKARVRPA